MPFNPTTGVFTRVSNSFSNPVNGATIDPTAADGLFDDYDAAFNQLASQVYYAADFGVLGDGTTDNTTALQTALNVILAAGGGKLILPHGDIRSGALTYSTATVGLHQGVQIEGQGRYASRIIMTGASAFWLTVDTAGTGWQSGVTFKDFSVVNVGGPPVNSGGISINMVSYAKFDNMRFGSLTGTGIFCTCTGDPDSSFVVVLDRVRIDNCAKTANTWGLDFTPTGSALELSSLRVINSQFEANGVSGAVANPPTSGAIQWRGLLCEIVNTGFTINQNSSLYIPPSGTAYGLILDAVDFENTISTVHPHVFVNSGLRGFNARNIEFLSNDSFVCQGGITLDSTNGAIGNVTIDGVKVRASTGNNPYVAFKATGANLMSDTIRVRNVYWTTFDGTGQTRFSGIQFDAIPGQCELSVSALGTVKLAPTGYGSTMPIRLQTTTSEWVPVQIPSAGITLAGLVGLSASTDYYLYLHNTAALTAPIAPAITLSTSVPVLDSSGYFVKTADATSLFLGSFTTDGAGSIVTTSPGYSFYPPGGGIQNEVGVANSLMYYTGTGTAGPLATANNGFLVTNGSGVPSISNTVPGFNGTGAINVSSSIKSTSTTAGLGYGTGAGGTVTQVTSKTTGVTLNRSCGQITMVATGDIGADTTVSFVLTDSAIAATDVLVLNHVSGGTPGSLLINAQCAAGSATINVRNVTPANMVTPAPVISFAVIKAVTA